jgi:hypothetical protein
MREITNADRHRSCAADFPSDERTGHHALLATRPILHGIAGAMVGCTSVRAASIALQRVSLTTPPLASQLDRLLRLTCRMLYMHYQIRQTYGEGTVHPPHQYRYIF